MHISLISTYCALKKASLLQNWRCQPHHLTNMSAEMKVQGSFRQRLQCIWSRYKNRHRTIQTQTLRDILQAQQIACKKGKVGVHVADFIFPFGLQQKKKERKLKPINVRPPCQVYWNRHFFSVRFHP